MITQKTLIVSAFFVLTALGWAASAEARPRLTGHSIERSVGQWNSHFSYQTRRGEAVKTISRTYDQNAGSAFRTRTLTAATGATAAEVRQIQRTEHGYTAVKTYTDFQGRTAQRTMSAEAVDGTLTRTRGATFRNGETANAIATASRTDNGYIRTREVSTSTGRGGALNVEGVRTETGGVIDKVVTNADGEIVGAKSTSLTNTDTVASKTTTFTNSAGEAKTITRSVSK